MAGANWGANLIGGAGTGAAAGTAVMPGWGTAIGAGVGLLGGIFQSIAEDDNEARKQELLDNLAQQTNTSYADIKRMYDEFYSNYQKYVEAGGGSQQDAIDAANAIRSWPSNFEKRLEEAGLSDPEDYKFNYDKTVEDFLNPYMGNVIDVSNAKVQHSAAGAAMGRSTGAAKAIAENTAREYNDIYNTALTAYGQDRSQAYNEWAGYINNMQHRLDTILANDKWGIEQQKALGDEYWDFMGQKTVNDANLEKDRIATQTQIELARI